VAHHVYLCSLHVCNPACLVAAVSRRCFTDIDGDTEKQERKFIESALFAVGAGTKGDTREFKRRLRFSTYFPGVWQVPNSSAFIVE